MHTSEHPNAPAENADWRKKVDDLHEGLASHATSVMRNVPPRGRPAYEELADQLPVILSEIRDLESLQKERLDDIRRCHDQWQTALSDRTGELGDLDERVRGADNKIRQQQSKLDEQMQSMSQSETAFKQRQAEADRTFATTLANTAAAERTISGLTGERIRVEGLRRDLEAKEQYQESQTLALSKANAQLDQDVASNNAKERKLARDRKTVREQQGKLDQWKAYKDHQVASAVATANEAAKELSNLKSQMQQDLGIHTSAMAGKDGIIEELHGSCDSIERERDDLNEECNKIFAEKNRLIVELDDLSVEKADLVVDRKFTEAELERLTAQLQSCHCSASRKRSYDQVDSGGEEASTAGQAERKARRLGKTPESPVNLNVVGPSVADNSVEDSVSPRRPGSRGQEASSSAGPSIDDARPLMNTAAPRALGRTDATITPSDGVAFTLLITDAKLGNFSSDVLPNEVLQALRRRFEDWGSRSRFTWAKVQSLKTVRGCIEARWDKKMSQWDDGLDYACALCVRRMRLCIVVHDAERVLLLPRKAAENEGRGPTDPMYWTR